jgi:hypothetical protein
VTGAGVAERFQEAVWALEQAAGRLRAAARGLEQEGWHGTADMLTRWAEEAERTLGELTSDLVRP